MGVHIESIAAHESRQRDASALCEIDSEARWG
jgi:hypothetical protein